MSFNRPPDKVIEDGKTEYLYRWHLIPRNPLLNIYLHHFLGSDKDVLHDHPWASISFVLRGGYTEHTIHSRLEVV
jgi:hypothetical protein